MAQLLHPKKASIFDDDKLSSEDEIKIRNDLGKFTISLIKAILQTSFYKTDHTLTLAAVDEFFVSMKPLKDIFLEITYMSAADVNSIDFTIEGIMVEPINLKSCIKSVLAEEFLGKLRDFFAWNKLVSFSLKREVSREEFIKFLSMTRRKLEDRAESAEGFAELEATPLEREGNRLSDVMVANGLFTVSAICRDEIVFVDRKLPWRVKLALGRLMKNLKEIPIYARATRRELQDVKSLLLQEIIRPLRGQNLLMEFLFNCDLVAQARGEELEDFDIEEEILAVLVRTQLLSVSNCFLQELSRMPAGEERVEERRSKGIVLLRKCAIPLLDVLDDESMSVFREASNAGFFKMKELPRNVQAHIQIEKEVDRFLEDPQEVLEQIQLVDDITGFRRHASNVALMVSELIRRDEYRWARQLVDLMTYLAEAPMDGEAKIHTLARDILDAMASKDNFERMVKALPNLRPQEQDHVFHLCQTFRGKAVPVLVGELRGELDEGLRANIRTVLEQMGEDKAVLDFLRHAMDRTNQRPEFYRDFLLVLGALRDEQSYELANQFLGDEVSSVRQAAFTAVTRIGQKKAERDLVRGLMDPDLGVRRAVVVHLGEINSQSPEFRDFLTRLFSGALSPGAWAEFMSLIQRRFDKIQLRNLQLMNSGASALAHLLDSGVVKMSEVEERLAKVLDTATRFHLIAGGEKVRGERAQLAIAMIRLLSKAGTGLSIPALVQARESNDKDTHHMAKAAVRDIMEREGIEERVPLTRKVKRWVMLLLGLEKERAVEDEGEDAPPAEPAVDEEVPPAVTDPEDEAEEPEMEWVDARDKPPED